MGWDIVHWLLTEQCKDVTAVSTSKSSHASMMYTVSGPAWLQMSKIIFIENVKNAGYVSLWAHVAPSVKRLTSCQLDLVSDSHEETRFYHLKFSEGESSASVERKSTLTSYDLEKSDIEKSGIGKSDIGKSKELSQNL